MVNVNQSETNGITLLPCPFCGGEATKQFGFNVSQNLKGRIICSCGAEIRQGRNATEQEIIEKWNTRAERTCRAVHDKAYYKGIRGYCEGLKCSECDEPLFSDFNHCPWCGAKVEAK